MLLKTLISIAFVLPFITSSLLPISNSITSKTARSAQNQKGPIVNTLSGKCLDPVDNSDNNNGAAIQLSECDNSSDQIWELTGENFLWNQTSDQCLDVVGAPGYKNGTMVELWDCENGVKDTDQTWSITSDGYIQNNFSGRCLDVPGAQTTTSGARMQIWDCEFNNPSTTDQRWTFNKGTSGSTSSASGQSSNSSSSSNSTGKDILLFDSDMDGDKDIYTMDLATLKTTQLTNDPGYDGAPSWSPDAKKIVFISNRNGTNDLFTMNSDGSNQKALFTSSRSEFRPDWSPDGSAIAYESDFGGSVNIFTIKLSNNAITQCTTNNAADNEAHWSQDGSSILFTSSRSGNNDIYSTICDGITSESRITNNDNEDGYASYSPDGKQMIFHSKRDGVTHVFLKDWSMRAATGNNESQVTPNSSADGAPTWSPDGKRITFVRGVPFEVCIKTLGISNDDTTCVTSNSAWEEYPSFKPNGVVLPSTGTAGQSTAIDDPDKDGMTQAEETWVANTFTPQYYLDVEEPAKYLRFAYQVTPMVLPDGINQNGVVLTILALYEEDWAYPSIGLLLGFSTPEFQYHWHYGDNEAIEIWLTKSYGSCTSADWSENYPLTDGKCDRYTMKRVVLHSHSKSRIYEIPARQDQLPICFDIACEDYVSLAGKRHPWIYISRGKHGAYIDNNWECNLTDYQGTIAYKDWIGLTKMEEYCSAWDDSINAGKSILPLFDNSLNVGEVNKQLITWMDGHPILGVFEGENIWGQDAFCGGNIVITKTAGFASEECAGSNFSKWCGAQGNSYCGYNPSYERR